MNVNLEIPDAIARQMHLDLPHAQRRALVSLVVDGYRAGELSRGQVSELLDLSFSDTEALLKESGCGLGLTTAEFSSDYEQARAFIKQ